MRIERVGLSLASVGGASGVQAVFLPGANVKGRILRTLVGQTNTTANAGEFFAGATAPASSADLTAPMIASFVGAYTMHGPLFLPAGYGLWIVSGAVSWAWATFEDIP